MDQLVKQRVVGAVVLVALAVIFIPILLEGPEEDMPRVMEIPRPSNDLREGRIEPLEKTLIIPQETVTTVVIEEPVKVAEPEPPAPAKAVPPAPPKAEEKPVPASVPEPKAPVPQPAAKTVVPGWVVQLGSFGSQSNAMALRDKLREAGFPTFVEQVQLASGITYRVRVGPELDRARAMAQQQKIAKALGIDGRVMSHP